jgi:hypothetical protein
MFESYRLRTHNPVPGAEEKASPVTACALHALPPPGVTVTLDLHSLLKPVTIAILFFEIPAD